MSEKQAMTETEVRESGHAVISSLQSAEDLAGRAGLYLTMQAINTAKNAAGWELAEKLGGGDG